MNFDNAAFKHRMPQQKTAPSYEKLPMKRGIFFDMFPFSVIFRRDMTMYRIGDGLKEVFSDLQGKKVNEEFTLVRPMLEFSWDNVSFNLLQWLKSLPCWHTNPQNYFCWLSSDLHPFEQCVWAAVESGGGEQAEGQHPQTEQRGAGGEGRERESKEGRRKRCQSFHINHLLHFQCIIYIKGFISNGWDDKMSIHTFHSLIFSPRLLCPPRAKSNIYNTSRRWFEEPKTIVSLTAKLNTLLNARWTLFQHMLQGEIRSACWYSKNPDENHQAAGSQQKYRISEYKGMKRKWKMKLFQGEITILLRVRMKHYRYNPEQNHQQRTGAELITRWWICNVFTRRKWSAIAWLEFSPPSSLPSLARRLNSNTGSLCHPSSHCFCRSEQKAVEEMKGTDQEYSSALTQYNSSANSGGEDIELLAFQTVTG